MNSIETKGIEQDELCLYFSRLNYDSGAAVTALPIATMEICHWRNAVSFEWSQEQSFPIWARSE